MKDWSVLMAQLLTYPSDSSRTSQLRLGIWIELVTIVWMIVEAAFALVVGFATHSVSLQGFGIDSLIELLAGSILLWRFFFLQTKGDKNSAEHEEARAARGERLGLFGIF